MIVKSARLIRPSRLTAVTFRLYSIQVRPVESNSEKLQQEIPTPKPSSLAQALFTYENKFPKDLPTLSKIDHYQSLTRSASSKIRIGIIYDDVEIFKRSKVLEVLLADPLASGNQEWFSKIANRPRDENVSFSYGEYNHGEEVKQEDLQLPAPILSSLYRPSFQKSFHREILPAEKNNIELIELNTFRPGTWDSIDFNQFHLFVNVTSNVSQAIRPNSQTALLLNQNQIVLTVVDNKDLSPSSTEESPINFDDTPESSHNNHIIKINSELYYEGIVNFFKLDAKGGSQFVDSLIESNIFELQKALGWYSSTPILSEILLRTIYNNIKASEINLKNVTKEYQAIKSTDLASFSQQAHSELQYNFIPETERFFAKNLRWWKLYLKNDNVEYDLKDYFNKAFMPKSIENFNFLRGKIVNRLQSDKYGEYKENQLDVGNPLIALKNKLISDRIATEVQPVVFSAITQSVLLYQIPTAMISFLSYQYFDFSANSAVAVFALGLAVGFNHASKKWERFSSEWVQSLFEDVRLCVAHDCVENGLVRELDFRYREESRVEKVRKEILDVLAVKLDSVKEE